MDFEHYGVSEKYKKYAKYGDSLHEMWEKIGWESCAKKETEKEYIMQHKSVLMRFQDCMTSDLSADVFNQRWRQALRNRPQGEVPNHRMLLLPKGRGSERYVKRLH